MQWVEPRAAVIPALLEAGSRVGVCDKRCYRGRKKQGGLKVNQRVHHSNMMRPHSPVNPLLGDKPSAPVYRPFLRRRIHISPCTYYGAKTFTAIGIKSAAVHSSTQFVEDEHHVN